MIILLSGLSMSVFAQQNAANSLYRMRTSLLFNAGISDCRQPSLGFTVNRVGKFGYYANFMIGLDNMHMGHDYHAAPDGSLVEGENAGLIPFYSGKRAYNHLSATVGAISYLGIPLYLYVGAGYGFRSETRQLLNKQWVEAASSLRHSAVIDAGFIGRIDNFTIMAGYTLFVGQTRNLHHEAKIGIGYVFDK